MRQLVVILGLLLSPLALGEQAYVPQLPSPDTVFAEVWGDNESDTAARQLAAIDALIELIKEKKSGGKYSGTLSPEAEQQLAAYNDAHRTLYFGAKSCSLRRRGAVVLSSVPRLQRRQRIQALRNPTVRP